VAPRTPRPRPPAWALGTLTHAALRRWRFAEDDLRAFLPPLVLQMGIVDPQVEHNAIGQVVRMLGRFRAHPLWTELDGAQRWHELPYSLLVDGRTENGVIDLLYRAGERHCLVEFKTDELRSAQDLRAHIRAKGYDDQVRRYQRAVCEQLGVEADAVWVFLNVRGPIVVLPAP
jgi:ATP-dependent exoDNAse (exonuclease V) beta subunit